MLFFVGASFLLNFRLESMDKKIDSKFELLRSDFDSKFELLRSDLKEISRDSNQRILALEIDKGVRQAIEKDRRNRRRHEDQDHDLSHSNDTKSA